MQAPCERKFATEDFNYGFLSTQNLITGDGNLPEPRNDRRLKGTLILGARGMFHIHASYNVKVPFDVAGRMEK